METKKKIFTAFFLTALLASSAQKTEAAPEIVADASLRPAVTEYAAGNLKDPFAVNKELFKEEVKVEEVPRRPLPPLSVQGLVWGGSIPQAIINDQVVKIGDTIAGVSVTNISKAGIKVVFDNQEYDLPSPASINLQDNKQEKKGEKDGKK